MHILNIILEALMNDQTPLPSLQALNMRLLFRDILAPFEISQ